jgi:acetyl-CoA carboxylase biotin carboxyl carrier protein
MATLEIRSEITGTVCKIVANVGDHLEEDDTVLLIESMKMEIPVLAPAPGKLVKLHVAEGDAISENDVLATTES